ncbi:MAG: baseplate J/gp47 family protein [Helicobacter sp.]|uniref:baseplate J/gp47 family protein n=1 Tax=Helicobacter sp. TaxID=218 RepID=UPI0023D47A2D|nr:baseplate J/gp47 family protein [Helicobacter sp.]MDE7175752.1 baseplate J/gp47 family protein [Helicobacter sp.]
MSSVLTPLSYEESLLRIEERIKRVYPNYERLESDSWSVVLEAFAYELTLLEQRRVDSIKALLLKYAQGEDLDNLCALYDTKRLDGAYPYAYYTFSLSATSKQDLILPKGLELGDESGEHRAYLQDSLLIRAGELSAVGIVEYFKKQPDAQIKCENLLTPLTFSLKVEAQGNFANGGAVESDTAFKNRSLLSLHSHTTAGSAKAYAFHAKSADSRIDDVGVITEKTKPGIVDVYLQSQGGVDTLMIERVQNALSGDSVRPLTDQVFVYAVAENPLTIVADIFLFDLKESAKIAATYDSIFKERKFRIGEDLPLSEIIRDLHQAGVYKVELKEPTSDVTPIDKKEVIKIQELILNFKEAPLDELNLKAKL